MEHRSTSDLQRDLQAITAELVRRHGRGSSSGFGPASGGANNGGETTSGFGGSAARANVGGVHGGPASTSWTGGPPTLRAP